MEYDDRMGSASDGEDAVPAVLQPAATADPPAWMRDPLEGVDLGDPLDPALAEQLRIEEIADQDDGTEDWLADLVASLLDDPAVAASTLAALPADIARDAADAALRERLAHIADTLSGSPALLEMVVETGESFLAAALDPPSSTVTALAAPEGTAQEGLAQLSTLSCVSSTVAAIDDRTMVRTDELLRADRAERAHERRVRDVAATAGTGTRTGTGTGTGTDAAAGDADDLPGPSAMDIALARRVSVEKTRRDLAAARRTAQHLPHLQQARTTGRVPVTTTSTIAGALSKADEATRRDIDAALAAEGYARLDGLGATRVREQIAAMIHARTDIQDSVITAVRAARDRHVTITPADHGMARLTALLPAIQAAQIHHSVQAIAESARAAGSMVPIGAARADALVEAVNYYVDVTTLEPQEDDDLTPRTVARGLADRHGVTSRDPISPATGLVGRAAGDDAETSRPSDEAGTAAGGGAAGAAAGDMPVGMIPAPPSPVMDEDDARRELGLEVAADIEFFDEDVPPAPPVGPEAPPSLLPPDELTVDDTSVPDQPDQPTDGTSTPVRPDQPTDDDASAFLRPDGTIDESAIAAAISRRALDEHAADPSAPDDLARQRAEARATLASVRAIHAADPAHGSFGPHGAAHGIDPGGPRARLHHPTYQARGPRISIGIIITDSALLTRTDTKELAQLSGYGLLPSHHVRAHLAHQNYGFGSGPEVAAAAADHSLATAEIRRLYTHPHSGEIMAVEHAARTFPASLRTLIRAVDPKSRTPWSNATTTQIDHVIPARDGGPTSLQNAQGLDTAANLAKETGGWSTTREGDPAETGTSVVWKNPYGSPPAPGTRGSTRPGPPTTTSTSPPRPMVATASTEPPRPNGTTAATMEPARTAEQPELVGELAGGEQQRNDL